VNDCAVRAGSTRGAVITGCGVVSPLGVGVSAFWEGLVAGRSAAAPITGFPADDLSPRAAAEVRDGVHTDADRAGAFAVLAAEEALRDAGLSGVPPTRTGVALGTTLGGMRIFERWYPAGLAFGAPGGHDLKRVPYFAPAVRLATAFGCRGPVVTTQLACASGTQAVAMAADWVRAGQVDVALAGGTDLLCRFVVAGFNALRATADVARPFDRDRRGLVLGEGAAIVVVEDAEHAMRRGGRIHARLLGVGAAGDAVHMTAPDREGRGAARAMRAALDDAGLVSDTVDFLSAHGTGTPYNDAMEAVAIGRVFAGRRVPVNSIKGAIGHTLGAAGAFEVVLCVRTIASGVIPPTAGLRALDQACASLDVVRGEARACRVSVALSTSSGFAGTNAAVLLGAA
jgi:3-oxoacyl-(acyl-carrier-protein) synthase